MNQRRHQATKGGDVKGRGERVIQGDLVNVYTSVGVVVFTVIEWLADKSLIQAFIIFVAVH
jgi:hypothetical protein